MKLSNKTILETINKHVELLKKYRVKKIGLFGSYARGDQHVHSDIDLLVEFDLSTFDEECIKCQVNNPKRAVEG